MKRVFLIISIIFASQIAKSQSVTPDSYDWADNPEAYIGKTIVLLARTEGTDKYVINQQERYEASYNKNYTEYRGERLFCYKKFKELKTGVKIVVNIPQKFWDNKGALIPKEYNGSYYKLTLKVTGEEPQNVCDGNRVSGSGSNRVFYILEKIVRYNNQNVRSICTVPLQTKTERVAYATSQKKVNVTIEQIAEMLGHTSTTCDKEIS